MSNIIVGTAGHIDHGKTTLIKKMTGMDTDQLKEESRRGISIDLGFAHLNLANGNSISFIDVPGHEKFIKNMLAGTAGIDLALLVIAANEGIMPQTKEHLEIIELLNIKKLIIVISKIDLVKKDMLAILKEEVKNLLEKTDYAGTPIIDVSAVQEKGIDELVSLIERIIDQIADQKRPLKGVSRMPIDRVFTVKGFGTVVTGTLFSGEIEVGDVLEVSGKKIKVRVRNLQVHHQNVHKVVAGQRVALNISGIETNCLKRGDVLITPGSMNTTQRIDCKCKLLESAPMLQTGARIRFYQGTKEVLGRVSLLSGKKELFPGQEDFIQLILEEPILVSRGDCYIIRSYFPLRTIAGGKIIEVHAIKHKSTEKNIVTELLIKESGQIEQRLKLYLKKQKKLVTLGELKKFLMTEKKELQSAINNLVSEGEVIQGRLSSEEVFLASPKIMAKWEEDITREIYNLLEQEPLAPGINKEEIRHKYFPELSGKDFNRLIQYWLEKKSFVLKKGAYLFPSQFQHRIPPDWLEHLKQIENKYKESEYQIPSWQVVKKELGIDAKRADQIAQYLIEEERLTLLAKDIYIWGEHLRKAEQKIEQWLIKNERITVAQARDLLNTTRKIIIPLLEFLDKKKVTVRYGDERRRYLQNK